VQLAHIELAVVVPVELLPVGGELRTPLSLALRDGAVTIRVQLLHELLANCFTLVLRRGKPLHRSLAFGDFDVLALGLRLVRRELVLIQHLVAVEVVLAPAFDQGRFGLRFFTRDRAVLVGIEPSEELAVQLPERLPLMLRRRYSLLRLLFRRLPLLFRRL